MMRECLVPAQLSPLRVQRDAQPGGLVGDLERLKLIQLKRDLLSKHDVTDGKSPLGKEAHDTHDCASGVELLDV